MGLSIRTEGRKRDHDGDGDGDGEGERKVTSESCGGVN